MPIVNITKNEDSPVFSTTTPCSARYLVTIDAGMPQGANLPLMSRPGVTMVALIGSSIVKLVTSLPKPCHLSLDFRNQFSRLPMPVSARSFGPQTLNHQSSPNSSSTLRIARRNSSDSKMDSSTSAVPPGGSIIAAATSHDAMIAYCGLVDVCIRNASLKRCRSSWRLIGSCTRICEACDSPASSLCVDCVEKIIDSALRGRSGPKIGRAHV